MKSILKKFLLIFVVGILSQPCIKNTCWASAEEKIKTLDKKGIWKIIEAIANKANGQPKLSDKIKDLVNTRALKCESFQNVTFAEFVKNLDGKTLFTAFIEKSFEQMNGEKCKYVRIADKNKSKIDAVLGSVTSNLAGKLLVVRLLIQIDIRAKEEENTISKMINFWEPSNENDKFSFCYYGFENGQFGITCAFNDLTSVGDIVLVKNGESCEFKSIEPGIPEDVALFHEMLHMYHYLNNRDRYYRYRISSDQTGIINPSSNPVFKYYFGNPIEINDEIIVWGIKATENYTINCTANYTINCEELLTICGLSSKNDDYSPGDELSENLYRFFRKTKSLRFGHRIMNFKCNKDVINKLIIVLKDTLKEFGEEIEIDSLVSDNFNLFEDDTLCLKKDSESYNNLKNGLKELFHVK